MTFHSRPSIWPGWMITETRDRLSISAATNAGRRVVVKTEWDFIGFGTWYRWRKRF